jgi:hypothetical protein
MKKYSVLIFILFYGLVFTACFRNPVLRNKYPSSLSIPGTGTLKYVRTVWDQHDIYNNRGIEIYDAVITADQMWIFSEGNYGDALFKGLNTTASVTIQYPIKGDFSFRYAVWNYNILQKDDSFLFFVSNDTTYYEDGGWIYYFARVDIATMNRQYIRLPDVSGSSALPFIYNFNNEVIFHYNYYDPSNYDISLDSYYKLDEDFDLVQITGAEFDGMNIPEYRTVIDNHGRQYRIYHGFEVSVDDGTTWREVDMGTNRPVSVLIQNEYIYVFCGQLYEMFNEFHSEYVGGGIHIFKWEL